MSRGKGTVKIEQDSFAPGNGDANFVQEDATYADGGSDTENDGPATKASSRRNATSMGRRKIDIEFIEVSLSLVEI